MAEQAKKDEKPAVVPDKDKVSDDVLEKVLGGRRKAGTSRCGSAACLSPD